MKVRELIVPLAIVAMIVGMVLPLPAMLLDILLIVNLLLATALLLSALSVNDPIKLSALPTILLLATLYRLTLNISTTRLILSGGDAGKVVTAFGSVVIGGSLAVGLVVFLIITLIQFIVIAKGAERIAEVAARFTLDALPGKQMSVDADVRSGLIDIERARDKREELQVESRFYGALDGAMKFVKGDAIAGLIIVGVNIVGGILVGMLVEHLSAMQALQKFVTLTIGDGLVSQIPALLNSLTAGIIVTKVARNENSSVTNELFAQIGQGKMVRGVVCFVSLLLGCLPGMPSIPFMLIGIGLLLLNGRAAVPEPVKPTTTTFQPRVPPLLSLVGSAAKISELQDANNFQDQLEQFRQYCFERYGFLLPRVELSFDDSLQQGLALYFRGSLLRKLEFSGIDAITTTLRDVVTEYRTEFVDDMHTRRLLDFFETTAPELVSTLIPSIISVTQLTVILRALTRDGISLKHFDLIMQAIAESATRVNQDRQYLEEVRVALGRVIVIPYLDQNGELPAITIDPLVDLAFTEAERGLKVVDPIIFSQVMEFTQSADDNVVLIVSKGARALLADCLRARGAGRAVLAFEEIPRGIGVRTVANFQLEARESDRLLEVDGGVYDQ